MNRDWLATFESLQSVYIEGAYSNIAVNEAVSRFKDVRESFVRTFAKGVLRDSIYLDYVIDKLAQKGIGSIKKRVLVILRMGIYAADSLDSVPEHAAVDEAVKLSKIVAKGSDRFINGMLRSYLRRRDEFRKDGLEPHIRYSMDEGLYSLLREQYGEEAEDIADALNKPSELYIRANKLKTDAASLVKKLGDAGIDASLCSENSEAVHVKSGSVISGDMYREGLFTPQSLSSMMAVKALSPMPGQRVLDVCSAPGGKTGYMAELMNNEGSILAMDIHAHRIALTEASMKRIGADIVSFKEADASVFDESLEACFDAVLCDVPCSGFGVASSKPEIKLNFDKKAIDDLIEVQKKILANAVRYAREGGRIMYSTCTLNRDENEAVVKDILSRQPNLLRLIDIQTLLPYNGKVGFFYSIIEKNAI